MLVWVHVKVNLLLNGCHGHRDLRTALLISRDEVLCFVALIKDEATTEVCATTPVDQLLETTSGVAS